MIHKRAGQNININAQVTIDEITYPAGAIAAQSDRWPEWGITAEDDPAKTPGAAEALEQEKRCYRAVRFHLDAKAVEARYESIISACSYAGTPNKYQEEAIKFLLWRAATWSTFFDIMSEVSAGKRPVPKDDELVMLLPVLS